MNLDGKYNTFLGRVLYIDNAREHNSSADYSWQRSQFWLLVIGQPGPEVPEEKDQNGEEKRVRKSN